MNSDVFSINIKSYAANNKQFSRSYQNFTIRLNKKSKTGKYRYKVNKAGIVAYLQYKRRIENGFDLNLHRRFPERVNSYSGITKQGVLELGLEAGEEAQ